MRDSAEDLAKFDVEVLYVSLDTAEKNAEFAEAMKTKTLVLSDPDGTTARRFGVVGFGGLYSKRWTFYIDGDGILRDIDKNVNPGTAGQDIVERLEALGFPRLSSSPAP
ncbi:MAG: hypothetical protein CL931_14410 [Deltaproteobacteria bacterium]|nr:hypothetical protein [Deltaproteobacteria bacterium]